MRRLRSKTICGAAANFAAAPFKKGDIGIRLQAYEDIINLLLFWQRKGFLLKVGNLERREK